MTDEKSDLIGLSQSEIYESLIANDLIEAKDKFRAKQIWHWLYNKGEIDFEKMSSISKELRTDRLKTPRVKVPEGSVGITEQFSNIYTFESPGGWNIIGKTPYKIFNSNNKANPVLINPGDNVHFFPISKNEFLKLDEK